MRSLLDGVIKKQRGAFRTVPEILIPACTTSQISKKEKQHFFFESAGDTNTGHEAEAGLVMETPDCCLEGTAATYHCKFPSRGLGRRTGPPRGGCAWARPSLHV